MFITLIAVAIIMYVHGWIIFGSIVLLVSIAGILNLSEIIDLNKDENYLSEYKSKRMQYFNNLLDEKKSKLQKTLKN
jgi:hypothetical protein